jgi:two-component system, NarL family, invasion response regulator UvrY
MSAVVTDEGNGQDGLSQTTEVRTLVVDDQEPFRDALRHLIGAAPGFTLVGEACSGEDAISAVETLSPSLVLMDVRMPGIGGIEAARSIAERHPELMIVLISVHGDEELSPELIEQGNPAAFVLKQNLRPHVLRELWDGRQT